MRCVALCITIRALQESCLWMIMKGLVVRGRNRRSLAYIVTKIGEFNEGGDIKVFARNCEEGSG